MPNTGIEYVQTVKLTLFTSNRLPGVAPQADSEGNIRQRVRFDERGKLQSVTFEAVQPNPQPRDQHST